MGNIRYVVSVLTTLSFLISSITPSFAANQGVLGLPAPGQMVGLSHAYNPMLMKGLHIHPENPLLFNFIMDTGHSGLKVNSTQLRTESEKLIKYFLATLTIPEKDLWVNLSPYEKDRIIPKELGQTEMGREMLAQDYMLKQITASLIYPEKEVGKKFWDKVYAQAQARFGKTEIPVNTFNKVWILPDKAGVYVRNNTAFVVEARLKVMLEEDYLALNKNDVNPKLSKESNAHNLTSQIVREIILPQLEQEVNTGKNFESLRQVFHSLILATWYKKNLKAAFLNQMYSDKFKINGVHVSDKDIDQKIYQQYLAAYKKGVFNYIKEDVDRLSRKPLPRKYFSGGEVLKTEVRVHDRIAPEILDTDGAMVDVRTAVQRSQAPDHAEIAYNNKDLGTLTAADIVKGYRDKGVGFVDFDRKKDLDNAIDFISLPGEAIKIRAEAKVVETNEETFGVAYNKEEQVVYIEKAFLDRVQAKGNPFEMLTRTLVYALTDGTHEEKRVQEFEYAIKAFGREKLKEQLKGADFVGLYHDMLMKQLRSNGDPKKRKGIEETLKKEIWEIAVHRLNGDTRQVRVLTGTSDYSRTQFTKSGKGPAALIQAIKERGVGLGIVETDEIQWLNNLLVQGNGKPLNFGIGKGAKAEGLQEAVLDFGIEEDAEIKRAREDLEAQIALESGANFDKKKANIKSFFARLNRLKLQQAFAGVSAEYPDRKLGDAEEDQGDAHIAFYPGAGNPFHFAHFETAFRALAQGKASQVLMRVQGVELREGKEGVTRATLNDRHEMAELFAEEVNAFVPGLIAYSGIGKHNDLPG